MSQHFHFVAIFSESKSKVLENFTQIYEIRDVRPNSFETGVWPGKENIDGVTVFGKFGRAAGKTKLDLHAECSCDWFEVNNASKKLMTFCQKFKPEVAYIFYSGAIVSPKFIIYTREKGLLLDVGKVKLLGDFGEETIKIIKEYYNKSIDTYEEWEKYFELKPLMPIKKLV